MIDVVAENGWLIATLRLTQLMQMVIQARWIDEPAVLTLPHVNREHLFLFSSIPKCLPELCAKMYDNYSQLSNVFLKEFAEREVYEVISKQKKTFT